MNDTTLDRLEGLLRAYLAEREARPVFSDVLDEMEGDLDERLRAAAPDLIAAARERDVLAGRVARLEESISAVKTLLVDNLPLVDEYDGEDTEWNRCLLETRGVILQALDADGDA